MDNFEEASLEEVNHLLGIQPSAAAGEDAPVQIEVVPLDEGLDRTEAMSSKSEVAGLEPVPSNSHEQSERDNATSPRLPDPILGDPGTKEASEDQDLSLDSASSMKKLPHMDTVSLSDGEDEAKVEALGSSPSPVDKPVDKHNSDYLLERIRELKEEIDKVRDHTYAVMIIVII